MSAPRIIFAFLPFCHLSAINYQNWWKFDEVLTKTILHSFFRHGVLYASDVNLWNSVIVALALSICTICKIRCAISKSCVHNFQKYDANPNSNPGWNPNPGQIIRHILQTAQTHTLRATQLPSCECWLVAVFVWCNGWEVVWRCAHRCTERSLTALTNCRRCLSFTRRL